MFSLEAVLHGLVPILEFLLGVPHGLEVVQSFFLLLLFVLFGLHVLGSDSLGVHLLLINLDLSFDFSLLFIHIILLL